MLIIGCGYVGQAFMDELRGPTRPQGLTGVACVGGPTARVSALTRSESTAAKWQDAGVRGFVGDIMAPETLAELTLDADRDVLFAVGYDRHSSHSIEEVYRQGLENVLDHFQQQGAKVRRFIYLSSTGVYGDHQGDWVNEETAVSPERPGGKACVAAERLLAAHPLTEQTHVVLRLAGIYGPGRVPRLADIRDEKPIPAPANTWLNLIHRDDIVRVIQAVFAHDAPAYRYCVSDGSPVRRHDYYRTVAEVAGAAPPRLTTEERDSPAAQRSASDKRISNQRMMEQLKIRLKYPDCQSGLKDVIANSS